MGEKPEVLCGDDGTLTRSAIQPAFDLLQQGLNTDPIHRISKKLLDAISKRMFDAGVELSHTSSMVLVVSWLWKAARPKEAS